MPASCRKKRPPNFRSARPGSESCSNSENGSMVSSENRSHFSASCFRSTGHLADPLAGTPHRSFSRRRSGLGITTADPVAPTRGNGRRP
ncbi:hypothetical protein RHECNPAF_890087 [Rhizobium etli CNPAF512]|nr:hypothetical protein RHECNPAF_890087 [Rhizobium etli CNPAF512]